MRIVVVGRYLLEETATCSGVKMVSSLLTDAISCERDFEIFVITCSDNIRKEKIFERGNIRIFALPSLKRFGNIRLHRQERRWISEKIRGLSPDIVHSHDLGFYTLAGLSVGYPQVISVHGVPHIDIKFERGPLNRLRKFFISYLEKRCLENARWMIINTTYLEKELQGKTRARLFYLDNAVEDEFFRVRHNGNGRDLLFVGRVIPLKGVFTLVRAALKLKRDFPDVKLRVAGAIENSSYFSQIKDFILKNSLSENIIFLGALGREALLKVYSKTSIFVFPSFQEASPMAICEAMAAGLCIVATDVGGIPTLIRNNIDGILVPPGDAGLLYNAISRVINDDKYRFRLAENAKRQAERRFLKKKAGQILSQIYRVILDE